MGHYTTINRLRWALVALACLSGPPIAMAEDAAPVSDWAGYRATSDIALPFAKIADSASVRIEASYIGGGETSLKSLTTVVTAEAPVTSDITLLDSDSRLMQIETCRRQGLAICPILAVGGFGSGFIDNGNRLFTCRHVVGDWPLVASLLNNVPVRKVLPPLIVRNREGVLLYNSAYSQNALRFGAMNDDPRLDDERILKYRALSGRPLPKAKVDYAQTLQYLLKASDFVALDSDSNLIDPVPLVHNSRIAAGDILYLSGFPAETDLLPRRLDGTPDRLLVSSVLTAKVYTPLFPMLMASGLQRPGGSGGMVTNAQGDVIGMSCFADASNAFAFWIDADAQQQFWTQLKAADYSDVLAELPVESAARE
jgi:Trypsin-like peptidase domain